MVSICVNKQSVLSKPPEVVKLDQVKRYEKSLEGHSYIRKLCCIYPT